MARKNRKISRSDIYHVILRGVNKQRIFENAKDYEAFLRIMGYCRDFDTHKQALLEPAFFLYSYCIMDNHVHLLIQPNHYELGNVMKRIMTTYAIYFNTEYERVGHLFQDRYKSEVVEDIRYFYTLLNYIHRNPIEAGICEREEEYPFSSFNELSGNTESLAVTLCNFPEICERQEMIREQARYHEQMQQWLLNKKGDKPQMRSMNLLGITPEQIREFVVDNAERPKEESLLDKLKKLTKENNNILCQYLRTQLNWLSEEEKDAAIVKMLLEMTGAKSISEFQRLDKPTMRTALAIVRDSGVQKARLSRLTGIPIGVIRYAKVCIAGEDEVGQEAESESE